MKRITNISIILLLLISSSSFGQITLGRQVIGSTGGFATGTNISVSSTVGEAVVQTLFSTNMILTQGFQQTLRIDSSNVIYEVINESCVGAKNGSIFIDSVIGCPGPYQLILTQINDTTKLGQDTLSTGDYIVTIFGSNGICNNPFIIYVGLDSDEDCTLKFYTGITPNGDGKNDTWTIKGLKGKGTVIVFNRWGQKVFESTGYNNDWGGTSNGNILPDGDYYYVINCDDGNDYKGPLTILRTR
ncbi:MAG: gliding motility-associated C-terminal domain-containing protein [Flavobacteriales bacterium]|nr:gliding motility-associated C-terminal domain-containing protein [Flavobacteriales bacterium]